MLKSRYFSSIIILLLFVFPATAQELQAKLSILTNQISSETDKKIFQSLEPALNNFLNSRKWTSDVYQPNEKIRCNFLLNLVSVEADNVYKGTLTIQAARPVYNTSYESPLVNFMDQSVIFRYAIGQTIEFNENRVQGTDGLTANLTAVLAYYVYIILGMDYDSFSMRGGDPYFKKALNIVNSAPEGRGIEGWKPFDGMRNRYVLVDNLTNSRFSLIHEAIYSYYRSGLDQFYADEQAGREGISNALTSLTSLNKDNPNTMVMNFFFQGKGTELVNIFKKAEPDTKTRAREMLVKLDITNVSSYNSELK